MLPKMASTIVTQVPTFTFCGKFTGKTAAARWLRAFNHETACLKEGGVVPPSIYLQYIDMLLTDDAAEWAEANPEASRILMKEEPNQEDVTSFQSLLKQRFPGKAVEAFPSTWDREIADLKQGPDESLISYYHRTVSLMNRYGAKDRSPASPLSLAEGTLLDSLLQGWMRGLNDVKLKKRAIEGMCETEKSLRRLYIITEQARQVEMELEKLFREERKDNELKFYKNLAQRNMPTHQIEAMLASYNVAAAQQWAADSGYEGSERCTMVEKVA